MASSSNCRWVEPQSEMSLVWLILDDRKNATGFTGRPCLPAVIYTSHIASFLRFEKPVSLLYAIGGRQGDPAGRSNSKLSQVEVFDTWSHRWHQLPSLSASRVGASACSFGDSGGVLVAGGYTSNPSVPVATVEVYSPAENQWRTLAPLNQKRYGLVVLRSSAGIFAMGGSSGMDVSALVERYDAERNCWITCADLPEPLAGGRGVEVNGYLLYAGGFTPNGRLSNRIYIYDPSNDSWAASKLLLRLPRTTFAMCVNSENQTVLIAGGQAPAIGHRDPQLYDLLPDHFATSDDVEELSIAEIFGQIPVRPSGFVPKLECLPRHRTGCLGSYLENYGFVVIGGEIEGAHLAGDRKQPTTYEWTEALVFNDGSWNQAFPQPQLPRVAFGLAQTQGYPPIVSGA